MGSIPITRSTLPPSDRLAVKVNLPMLAKGDALYLTANYANGMTEYTTNWTSFKSSAYRRDVGGYTMNHPSYVSETTGIETVIVNGVVTIAVPWLVLDRTGSVEDVYAFNAQIFAEDQAIVEAQCPEDLPLELEDAVRAIVLGDVLDRFLEKRLFSLAHVCRMRRLRRP